MPSSACSLSSRSLVSYQLFWQQKRVLASSERLVHLNLVEDWWPRSCKSSLTDSRESQSLTDYRMSYGTKSICDELVHADMGWLELGCRCLTSSHQQQS